MPYPKARCDECEMFTENCTCHTDRAERFEKDREEWAKLGELKLQQASESDWSRYKHLTEVILEKNRKDAGVR